ncbi:MAG: hypothetical protein LQ345_006830 [Seirophora villosa]|nr:MAG: hypothetical protein LQ345_006830 [Seirophora villosa]
MKFSTVASIISFTLVTRSLAQGAEDPGPSPTASVGCEPHGDHWHCDGPRAGGVTTTPSAATAAAAAQNDETATPTFPAPTESVGCEAHGDHYHCSGPANTVSTATPAAAAAAEESDEDDHDHEGETPSFPPPTESVGCEAHGDHYHCSGPATAAQATSPPTASGIAGGANATSVAPATTAPAASGPAAGGSGNSTVPFEGAASGLQVMSVVAMTGLVGLVALFTGSL